MIIISSAQALMRILGILPTYTDQSWYRYYNYAVYILSSPYIFAMAAYIGVNFSDIFAVADSISLFANAISVWSKTFVLMWRQDELRTLLIELQKNIDQKERAGRLKHYVEMNDKCNFWTNLFIATSSMAVGLLIVVPAIYLGYHNFVVDDLTKEMLRYPVNLGLPFDPYRSPVYEWIYVATSVQILISTAMYVMVDSLFMGVCMLIIASQADLQDMLMEVVDDDRCQIYVNGVIGRSEVDRRIVECVLFHNLIYNHLDLLEPISTPFVSITFSIIILQMAPLAFDLQMNPNLTIGRIITNVLVGMAILFDVLIFCYFGNLVTEQGLKVAETAYQSSWYKCLPRQRLCYRMIVQRAQKPIIFMGFDTIECSLETFVSIINMVGSFIALMQTLT